MKHTRYKVANAPVSSFAGFNAAGRANVDPEWVALESLVDDFAAAIKRKLREVQLEDSHCGWDSYEGWDSHTSDLALGTIRSALRDQLNDGRVLDPVDIGAYAAFAYNVLADAGSDTEG